MKIRTKNPVDYHTGVKTTVSGVLEGHLINEAFSNGSTAFGANYAYATPEGEVVEKGGFTLDTAEEINGLHSAVIDSIPDGLSFTDFMERLFHEAFIVRMAMTFEIDPSEIEIVE